MKDHTESNEQDNEQRNHQEGFSKNALEQEFKRQGESRQSPVVPAELVVAGEDQRDPEGTDNRAQYHCARLRGGLDAKGGVQK